MRYLPIAEPARFAPPIRLLVQVYDALCPFVNLSFIDNFPGASRTHDMRSPGGAEETRQKPPGFRDEALPSQPSAQEQAQAPEGRNPLGAIGSSDATSVTGKAVDEKEGQSALSHDPLVGMAPIDKWGIKGLRTLMNNYQDYTALVTGMDPTGFGVDLTSPSYVILKEEPSSEQAY